jgi:cell division protein FtsI/penicillin-binding protein 2
MEPRVAAAVREMLRGTVAGGSATEADLGSFEVAGKTGTARRNVRGRYVPNEYTASFVGLFPANRPLYVILVKLDNPTGAYYGGKTAAPVSKAVLEAAVAARYRRAVLEPGGGRPAAALVEDFLGRPVSFDAFAEWLNRA